MSKHTPGPWAYTVDADGDNLMITAAKQTVVGGCGCCGSPSMDNPADAPLLAAAPDLLEALKVALRQNEHNMMMTGEECRLCRAAIAKAEVKA